jgi:tRNA(Ile2) C34 agmatinyltransferase TiaS
VARKLSKGDILRVYGGVRKATSVHPKVLNVERVDVLKLAPGGPRTGVLPGTYVASPRANRHLTKPLIRHGNEMPGARMAEVEGWLRKEVKPTRVIARGR